MMNGTQINCTSSTITTTETATITTTTNVDDTVATYAASAAGDADATTSTTSTATAAMPPEFVQLTETRRCIYRAIAAIHDESFNKLMIRLLRQFEWYVQYNGDDDAANSKEQESTSVVVVYLFQCHTRGFRKCPALAINVP